MSFFDRLGKAWDATVEEARKAKQIADDVYVNESNDFLKSKIKSGSKIERMAAAKVLRDRGHDVSI